jgi:cytochrome c oxidase subunit IV
MFSLSGCIKKKLVSYFYILGSLFQMRVFSFLLSFFEQSSIFYRIMLIVCLLKSGGSVSCIAVDHQSGAVVVADDRNQVLIYML